MPAAASLAVANSATQGYLQHPECAHKSTHASPFLITLQVHFLSALSMGGDVIIFLPYMYSLFLEVARDI